MCRLSISIDTHRGIDEIVEYMERGLHNMYGEILIFCIVREDRFWYNTAR